MNSSDLSDRIALVTGAARGLGFAIAEGLCRHGARVVLFDLGAPMVTGTGYKLSGQSELDTARERLGEAACAVAGSVTESADLDQAIQISKSTFGRAPEIVVANAGVSSEDDHWDMSTDTWDLIHGINLKGVWLTCRAAIPEMRACKAGRLILLSSNVALRPQRNDGAPAYTSSKAGVIGLTKALAADLGADGIRVNAVLPGVIPTGMNAACDLEPWKNQVIEHDVNANDVANAVVYLASQEAAAITGHCLPIDGGYSTV